MLRYSRSADFCFNDMKATLFIIPGFKEKVSDKQYIALRKSFLNKDYKIVLVPIVLNRLLMTDWIDQFLSLTLNPTRLFLCSLSPYFSEDLRYIPERWKRFIGKRRTEDFRRYSMNKAVQGLHVDTRIFIGGVEQEKFVHLKRRCAAAAEALAASLVVIPGVAHDIGDERYRNALIRELV